MLALIVLSNENVCVSIDKDPKILNTFYAFKMCCVCRETRDGCDGCPGPLGSSRYRTAESILAGNINLPLF
jgi:hypothetical protein